MKNKKVVWLMNERNGFDVSPALIWWYGILENMGYDVVYSYYEDYDSDEFYYSIKDYKPDFVIHPAYDRIHTEFLKLKEFTKVYVLQSDDRWRYINFSRYWIPFIDGVITYEGELENYVSDGLKEENFCKFRWSFNPNMMNNINEPVFSSYNISHTGGLHGNRQQVIDELSSKTYKVNVFKGITYDQTKNVWSNSKFSLCLTMNSTNEVRELKGRVVEIPNWTVLLTEPFPEMETYYDMDKECILFNSVDEAVDKIVKFDNDKKAYEEIFYAGKKRLWATNTVYHEWDKILPKIDPDYKPVNIKKIIKEKHGVDI